MIHRQFMDGSITGQIRFMNASIGTQKVAQTSPTAFIRVDMDFADAVSIFVACPFVFCVADRVTNTLQMIVAIIFISVERGFRFGEALHKRAEGLALGIFHDTDTHLARFSANHRTDGRTIILVGAASTLFVGSATRWILGISVPFSFFPQRSGTFRQSRLPDRSRVASFVHARRWLATGAELPSLWCG